MGLFNTLDISATALTAQQLRMDVLSQNMANVDTTRTAAGGPYKRQTVLFEEQRIASSFQTTLNNVKSSKSNRSNKSYGNNSSYSGSGVRVSSIVTDNSEGTKEYDPNHPDADADGYVEKPNVNIVTEMVNLISAQRSYEANVTALNITKSMINKTFEISKS